MWSAEGYRPLIEVRGWCLMVAARRREDALNSRDLEQMTDAEFQEIDLDEQAFEAWLFNRFMTAEYDAIYVCSPQGQTLRLSSYALDPMRVYFGPFPNTLSEKKQLIDQLKNNFPYFDNDIYTICLKDQNPELSFPEMARIRAALSPIEGWIVCWKTPVAVFTDEDFDTRHHRYLPRMETKTADATVGLKGGRPSVRTIAAQAYLNEFPNGDHRPLTWKEVERRIPYSKKTILRGLSQLNGD